MKTFINKKTEITQAEDEEGKVVKNLGYADLGVIGLNTPPQGGWTPSEMRDRIKVIDKLSDKELGAKIKLEDAEFKTLKDCAQVKWKMMHKDIVAFDDYLAELDKE